MTACVKLCRFVEAVGMSVRFASMMSVWQTSYRALHTSARCTAASQRQTKVPRIYRYWIDVHGQLFMYDTVPKNLTSCTCATFLTHTGFKSVPFLNFFFARIERSPGSGEIGPPVELCNSPHWTEDADALRAIFEQGQGWDEVWRRLRSEGISWLSKCQGEWNVIHAVDTPIVYRHLSQEQNTLTWGGDYQVPFMPSALRVHPDTGYLYHPSPPAPVLRGRQRGGRNDQPLPWGNYSLVASHVVLQHFADGLHIEHESGMGGSLQWRGQTYALDTLRPQEDLR